MKLHTYKPIDVSTATFPVTLPLTGSTSRYKIFGSKELSENVSIGPSGTQKEGMSVDIDYAANVTLGSTDYSLTIFATEILPSLFAKKLKIHCEYINGGWKVYVLLSMDQAAGVGIELINPDVVDGTTLVADGTTGKFKVKDGGIAALQLATDAVEEAKIKAKAVTLAKMADLAAGKIILGSAGNTPAAVTPTGDVTITNAGVMAIGAGKVLAGMVGAGELDAGHLAADAGVAFSQMEALTASKVPVINGSGVIVASGVDATKLGYIGNLTSDAQAQIDSGIAKVSHTVISSDTTATLATLKSSYIADTSAGAVALTLPLGSTLIIGTPVKLLRIGGNAGTLKANAADKIYPATSYTAESVGGVACSATGKSITAILKSTSEWQVIQAD